jgi:hypothetical protein
MGAFSSESQILNGHPDLARQVEVRRAWHCLQRYHVGQCGIRIEV